MSSIPFMHEARARAGRRRASPRLQLLLDRGVTTIGLDGVSVGAAHDGVPPHVFGLGRGMMYVELLANLSRCRRAGAFFIFLPIKIKGGSAGPGRAIALVPGISDVETARRIERRSAQHSRGRASDFLITGALGCIGAWTTKRLLDEGAGRRRYDLPGNPHRLQVDHAGQRMSPRSPSSTAMSPIRPRSRAAVVGQRASRTSSISPRCRCRACAPTRSSA